MQSKTKIAPVVGRDGFASGRDQDIPQLEIDATFARLLGWNNGQKLGLLLHMDPPQAHTINIEPLTPADWEMIELHAKFLELNFLSQVRALPNPGYTPADGQKQTPHALTLHLSPTSTANIRVASLNPAPPSSSPFVKIGQDAEVIVAPVTRERTERGTGRPSRSATSASKRSIGGKSGTSTVKNRSRGDDSGSKGVVFLRGVDRAFCYDYFDEDHASENEGLRVWVDKDLLVSRALMGATWVSVTIVKPAGLIEPIDPSKEQDAEKPATKLVARIGPWEDAPDSNHVALSSQLCQTLASPEMVGGLVRLEAAPPQAPRTASASGSQNSKDLKKRVLKVLPFPSSSGAQNAGLKFGGDSKQEREDAIQRVRSLFLKELGGNGLLDGALTDGMLLPASEDEADGWFGGIVKFDPPPTSPAQENGKTPPSWILGSEWRPAIEPQPEVAPPSNFFKGWFPGEPIPKELPVMVGIDPLIEELDSHLLHSSSVLLTGGLGAGKTTLSQLLAHRLREEAFFNTVYFSCRSLATNETRASTIKETLNRIFGCAAWGARLGGKAVVILDDLDRLCPAETELQVGDENNRSRQLSESLCTIVRRYCTLDSGVVLLATAQSKEAVNNVIVGGHVVREIVGLKAPNKDGRRKVLETLVQENRAPNAPLPNTNGTSQRSHSRNVSTSSSRPDTSGTGSSSHDGFVVDKHIDFLDIAGQTDGYMPGDLVLLVSRARSEALIRTLTPDTTSAVFSSSSSTISLTKADFTAALKGFTPASLRNVTLQHSTTRWSSIGGLHATRTALLETLQYPTTYAPIFAASPLRLRSGLLLYGYPGCGKTLLASAVAGECGLNFISVKGPEILNKYIGASEKSVRDLFERAQAARPCVLFFDEFDAIAPKRGHDSTGVTDRVVNQLLTQMDGAEGLSGVYVLAATSRPDLIDPALLRPGRLDKSLVCEMPSEEERGDILKAVGSKVRFSDDVRETGLADVARRTEGYSGADLQAVVYNAQLEAIHDVLGDDDAGELKPKVNGAEGGQKGSSKGVPNFIHFRYGDEEGENEGDEVASSAALTERAKIAAHLVQMQAMRRKEKQAQQQRAQAQYRPSSSYSNRPTSAYTAVPSQEDEEKEASGSKEPEIQWRHVQRSLETTRASVSPEERKRLARIYREFVEGRTGELPNGQGGTEIGGRASLM